MNVIILSTNILGVGEKIYGSGVIFYSHFILPNLLGKKSDKKGRKVMPKFRVPNYQKTPPIDWLWAAVLERKAVYGLDLNQMAELGGTSYSLMRRYIRRSPWTWPESVRESLCRELGLKVNVVFSPDRITVDGENV